MKRLFQTCILLLCVASTANAQLLKDRYEKDSEERIYLEFPILDLPYQFNVASATGNPMTAITNQSMATSLALTEDLQTAAHLGIRELVGYNRISKLLTWGYDCVAMFLPFSSSWVHEEYHRGVMGYRGVESFDEVWKLQFFASTISVSHETDEALTAFHDNYINDFIRMNAAGLEAQTHLVQRMQRNDFFYHRDLSNAFSHWMNIINNWGYLDTCADPESDAEVDKMNEQEATIESRDFTGLDLSAWAYELFHPGVKYADRGTHPSGVGIDRYIKSDKIGEDGLSYLKTQARRELLNLISPMMLGINRIRLASTDSGDWYGNFAVRHYLTQFGDDISVDLLLETPSTKLFAAPHMYSNYVSRFPGFELGMVDKTLCNDRLRMNATTKLWMQPDGFTAEKGKVGGMASADVAYSLGRIEPYVEISAKTAGWLVGEVNLDKAFTCRAGLRWLIFGDR